MKLRLACALAMAAACNDYALTGKPPGESGVADCALELPEAGVVAVDDACALAREPGSFEPQVEWRWDAATLAPGYDDPMMMPAVGDVDGDGMPEVVLTTYANNAYGSAGALVILSGDGAGEEAAFLDIGGYQPVGAAGVALGDLDADGVPEILTISTTAQILALHADGSLVWASEVRSGDFTLYSSPAIADLDADGQAEVVVGRAVFDTDGSFLGAGAYGVGGEYAISAVVDLDVDGQQEVIVGNAATRMDGSTLWAREDVEDGWPAVGDFDGDGLGEVVSVRGSSGLVTLLDTDGSTLWGPVAVPGGGGGPPTVADFDGDGAPEIGVAGGTAYTVFDTDGSVLWSAPTQDASSSRTGSSVFDFEGDGIFEVVYADELTLWVYDGATGAVRLAWDDHSSWTLFEYPVIVDVDADGQSEIVFMSNDGINPGWQGITVVGDIARSWAPTTPTWNQHAYMITNVEDDLSIPARPLMNWLTGHNSFRAGGRREAPGIPAPDLVPLVADVCWFCDAAGERVEVAVQVENRGPESVGGTIVAGLWAVSSEGEETLLQAGSWPLGLGAGLRSEGLVLQGEVGLLDVSELRVRVDDPEAWAALGLSGSIVECLDTNNAVVEPGAGCR